MEVSEDNKFVNLTKESAFLLYAMMSLSARHSSLPYFGDVPVRDRGAAFACKAQAMYDATSPLMGRQVPSLRLLQGCVLIAYYNQSCSPAFGSDLWIDICTRWGYRLGVYNVDDDCLDSSSKSPRPLSAEAWVNREEQRRVWWSIWELDTLDSVASRRPFSIDRDRFHVRLPVSDEAWFAGVPVASPLFSPDITVCWKILRSSPNQDERAWFLLSNYIMAQVHELGQRGTVGKSRLEEFETVLACFSLLFHDKQRPGLENLIFDETTYAKTNWLILTQLMVQT